MKMIRPVSDLRNHFADISKTVHESAQAVFLPNIGYGDMVVLSMDFFFNDTATTEIYTKLQAAEREEETNSVLYTSEDILAGAEAILKEHHAV